MNNRLLVESSHQENLESESKQQDEDLHLVEMFSRGDRIAFDRLVKKYQKQIMTLCVRLLGNDTDGEDAAQETFVKIYRNLNQFRGDCSFSTWIYTVAINTCRNMGKSWWNRIWKGSMKVDKPFTDEDGKEGSCDLRDTRLLPSKDFDRKYQAAAIKEALSKLPSIHRELVVLRDFKELRYEEIEAITGISSGTIKSRLARARAALQNELKGLYYES